MPAESHLVERSAVEQPGVSGFGVPQADGSDSRTKPPPVRSDPSQVPRIPGTSPSTPRDSPSRDSERPPPATILTAPNYVARLRIHHPPRRSARAMSSARRSSRPRGAMPRLQATSVRRGDAHVRATQQPALTRGARLLCGSGAEALDRPLLFDQTCRLRAHLPHLMCHRAMPGNREAGNGRGRSEQEHAEHEQNRGRAVGREAAPRE